MAIVTVNDFGGITYDLETREAALDFLSNARALGYPEAPVTIDGESIAWEDVPHVPSNSLSDGEFVELALSTEVLGDALDDLF